MPAPAPVDTSNPASRLVQELRSRIASDRVRDRALDRARMSHDASHYLLRPEAVVLARNAADVAAAVSIAGRHRVPVTFRSGGTSLSGQAQTSGVLIDTRGGFRDIEVLDAGAKVRCQPGATVRAVNARLAPHGRILGPDPASEAACTIGGVVANNSSGMSCGTVNNTYQTLDSIVVALLSGTVLDTAAPDADARLRASDPALWEGLSRLRDRVRGNPDSVRRIRHQFSMKNTMGYGINAFLDHESPVDILAHLMIGSEGTLGFILSATFRTVPLYPCISTNLLIFDRIDEATDAIAPLVDAGAATAELMDAGSLRVAQHLPTVVPALQRLEVVEHTALLVEAQTLSADELASRVADLSAVVDRLEGLSELPVPARFTSDAAERALAWTVRKGLYTAVASARPSGSTALLEDVVVPMGALTQTVRELGALCTRHGYPDTVVFGHAKDANLHFMINPDLRDPKQLDTYATFSDDLVDLILAVDGSLKAEHGTGRIMAPFVERQYGAELFSVMCEVKALLDPSNTLNPGVIIPEDAGQHLRDIKLPELVDDAVDRCVECGYCEPVCPSKDVTTTPRQRIALLRDMAAAERRGATAERDELAADYGYAAVQTCAVDSLCLLACPVAIDTGAFMKKKRKAGAPEAAQHVGWQLADNWGVALDVLRGALTVTEHVPSPALSAVTRAARSFLPTDVIPAVGDDLPAAGISRRTDARRAPGDVVFFSSCIDELFGGVSATGGADQPAAIAFLALCDRAGVRVTLPDSLHQLCCGTVWRSKGLTKGRDAMAIKTATALLAASANGALPVVTDASSCTHGLHAMRDDLVAAGRADLAEAFGRVQVLDSVRYTATVVLPKLAAASASGQPVRRKLASVVLHPTCSDRHAGDLPYIQAIAEACAEKVTVPFDAGCCGFAGDRGMLHPELTASATAREAAEVKRAAYDAYLSTNRTCELGMTRATGRPYRHVLQLLAELTR